MNKKAQNLVEYLLIFAMVAFFCAFAFAGRFNFAALKNFVFNRPTDSSDAGKIKIEAMTE